MGLYQNQKLRTLLTAAVITMVIQPAYADRLPAGVRIAQAQAEANIAQDPQADVGPAPVSEPSAPPQNETAAPVSGVAKKLRPSRVEKAQEAAADVPAPAPAAAPIVNPPAETAASSKLSHSSKPHSAKVHSAKPSTPVEAPVAEPPVAEPPPMQTLDAPAQPAPEPSGPSKLRHSAKISHSAKPSSNVAVEPAVVEPVTLPTNNVVEAPAPSHSAKIMHSAKPVSHSVKPGLVGNGGGSSAGGGGGEAIDRNEISAGAKPSIPVAEPTNGVTETPSAPTSANAPVSAAEVCPPAMAPKSSVAQTRDLQAIVTGKNTPRNFVLDDNEEENVYKQLKPIVPAERPQTPAKAPTGKFVKRLLEAAKREVTYDHRDKHTPPRKKDKRTPQLLCLQGVRRAVQKAANKPQVGLTNSAKDAGPKLLQYGFKKAPAGRYNELNAPVGSVLIYKATNNPRAHGHIEIKGTDGYYSDFYSESPISARTKARVLIGIYVPPAD